MYISLQFKIFKAQLLRILPPTKSKGKGHPQQAVEMAQGVSGRLSPRNT